MSVENGYSRYACDRSERSHPNGIKPIEYMTQDDKRVREWIVDASYTDVNGVERKITLCPECAPTYMKIRQDQAKEMQLFMDQ